MCVTSVPARQRDVLAEGLEENSRPRGSLQPDRESVRRRARLRCHAGPLGGHGADREPRGLAGHHQLRELGGQGTFSHQPDRSTVPPACRRVRLLRHRRARPYGALDGTPTPGSARAEACRSLVGPFRIVNSIGTVSAPGGPLVAAPTSCRCVRAGHTANPALVRPRPKWPPLLA